MYQSQIGVKILGTLELLSVSPFSSEDGTLREFEARPELAVLPLA